MNIKKRISHEHYSLNYSSTSVILLETSAQSLDVVNRSIRTLISDGCLDDNTRPKAKTLLRL